MLSLGVQALAHLFGDYVLQSGWMANNKTQRSLPALVHATVYTTVFACLLQPSLASLMVIGGTHFFIDRFRLARYVVFAKEFIAPRSSWPHWEDCKATGLPGAVPPWLAVWLMIIVDNTTHLTINALALAYL